MKTDSVFTLHALTFIQCHIIFSRAISRNISDDGAATQSLASLSRCISHAQGRGAEIYVSLLRDEEHNAAEMLSPKRIITAADLPSWARSNIGVRRGD